MTTDAHVYAHRNGETAVPELAENAFDYYWFDGTARYEEWHQRSNLVVVTGEKKDRVIGLVIVAMMVDMKHPLRDERGHFILNRPTMIATPETLGYDLNTCEGRFWGPVHMPPISQDMIPRFAAVMDYEQWVRFQPQGA